MYIEESFDTIFNMGYGLGKKLMDERVKRQSATWFLCSGAMRVKHHGIINSHVRKQALLFEVLKAFD